MLCPHCNLPSEHLFTARDLNRGHRGEFDYYRGPCGLVFVGTIPPDLGKYYAGGYQQIPADEPEVAEAAKAERYRLEPIIRHKKNGRFLEIGPWIGLTAYSARQMGFEVSALELNEDCVDLLQRSGIAAQQSNDPAASLHAIDGKFDVIALWHSIEHLPRPWEVIEQAVQKLAPGGILYVAAPNPDSAQLRVFQERWFHLDAPRHLYLLPARMIEEIGRRYGLSLLECTTDDALGKILDRDGWWHPLHNHVPIPGLRRLYKLLVGAILRRKHRRSGDFAGAGYSVMLQKPLS